MGHVKFEGQEVLRVLCGSRAYGLHDEDSDYDYHGVYVVPTERLLSIGPKIKETSWVEGEGEDNTAWEVGHFLRLATQCNPTVLEVFTAPIERHEAAGDAIRKLFPAVLSRKRVYDAFRGYGWNQRKKMLDDETGERRNWKFAVAYLRVLHHGIELLNTGTYHPALPQDTRDFLREVKAGHVSRGAIIDSATGLEREIGLAYEHSALPEQCDLERVNHILLHIRGQYWGAPIADAVAKVGA